MKSVILFLLCSSAFFAWGASADSLTAVVDLEAKITQKVKAILQPVEPDVIVVTKVEIKKTTTDILGTQLTAVGIFATGDLQKIEDTDIESISVTVLSKIGKFPQEISKFVESSVMGISKKGRVQFVKMEPATVDVILKRQEYQKTQSEVLQKIASLAEEIYQKAGAALKGMLIGFALVQLVVGLIKVFSQTRTSEKLGERIAAIKVGAGPSDEASRPLVLPPSNAVAAGGGARAGDLNISGALDKNPLEQMSAVSLRALLADAYWCEKDPYASWVWAQLSPLKKIELLESWPAFESYVSYLTRVEAAEERFHLDPSYLKPQECYQVSNQDLMSVFKTNKSVWQSLSQMRRQSLPLSLKERIDLAKMPALPPSAVGPGPRLWSAFQSPLRKLPVQLEIHSLTEQDEMLLMESPEMVTGALRRQLPSLVWVALLAKSERERLLQKVPAQSLAEVWVGPKKALQLILEVLPEKKKELLLDYSKKIAPNRQAPLVASLSTSALDLMENPTVINVPEMPAKRVA